MEDSAYFARETFELHPAKERYLAYLIGLLAREHIDPPARVLDVGAGTGLFAAAAEAAGYVMAGLEASEHGASLARQRVRGEIIRADAAIEIPLHDKSIDAVTMFDVIEHFSDHRAALANAHRVMRERGRIFVITLNAHSLARPLFGRRWAWYQDPTHVHLFSAATLRAALERAGFHSVSIRTLFNFCSAGESFPLLRPLRSIGRVVHVPLFGDSLLAVATR